MSVDLEDLDELDPDELRELVREVEEENEALRDKLAQALQRGDRLKVSRDEWRDFLTKTMQSHRRDCAVMTAMMLEAQRGTLTLERRREIVDLAVAAYGR